MCQPGPIAHTTKEGQCQSLYDHLIGTAKRAAEMATEFGCSEWGYLAGLWHDLGKFSADFQRYIRETGDSEAHIEMSKAGRVDHSTAGAILAVEQFRGPGRIITYLIAGHHAGLPDWESDTTGNAALSQRLRRTERLDAAREGGIPPEVLSHSFPKEHPKQGSDPALWIRLLFSCVVDADFLIPKPFSKRTRQPRGATTSNYPTCYRCSRTSCRKSRLRRQTRMLI